MSDMNTTTTVTENLTNEPKTLESIFAELDKVINQLENEDATLEESFQFYQKGVDLLREANNSIDTVEKKVQVLDESGTPHDF